MAPDEDGVGRNRLSARKVNTVEPEQQNQAERIWTIPNLISFARLLLVPVVAVLIFQGKDLAAVVVLAIAGISDYVDGWVARTFNQMSKLGRVLDPSADRLFIAVTLIGMAVRDRIPWWLVVAIGSRELLVGLTMPELARRGFVGYPVHLAGKAGTMALMYAFPLLLLSSLPNIVGDVAYVVGWAAAMWGVYLYWTAGIVYLNQFREVIQHDLRATIDRHTMRQATTTMARHHVGWKKKADDTSAP